MTKPIIGSRKGKVMFPFITADIALGGDFEKSWPKVPDATPKTIGQADIEKLQKAEEKRKMRANKRKVNKS